MPQQGVPTGPKLQGLSPFGEWVVYLCAVLATNQTEIARIAGRSQSTVSYNTREVSPGRKTVQVLWQALMQVAEEKQIALPYYVEMCFYNAAGFGTESQKDLSQSLLEVFKNRYDLGYEKQIEALVAKIREQEERITQLEQEKRQS